MRKEIFVVIISLAVISCVLSMALYIKTAANLSSATSQLESSSRKMAEFEEQIYKGEADRDSANRKVTQLQQELSGLRQQRKADRMVIEALWSKLLRNTSDLQKQNLEARKTARNDRTGEEDTPVTSGQRQTTVEYDAEAVKKMLLSSSGDLDVVVDQIVTAEGIDSTLQDSNDQPAYWAAAASLAHDPNKALEYLEQAARVHPNSPVVHSSLVDAHITRDQISESTLAHIEQFKKLDPTNSLADCYDAYCRFQNHDIEGALQSLSQASKKDRFADDKIDLLMARYEYFLNEGCSDEVAIGLSAFTVPLSHLATLGQVEQYSMDQARALSAAGQYDDALQITQDIANIGGNLSSSGRFLVYDRVGIALQRSALAEQRQIYETVGDTGQVQQIDMQLQAIDQRSSTIDVMVQAFGGVLQNMTDQDIANYVDNTILSGEFSTLQNIPEIAQALQQAQTQSAEESPE